MTHERESEQNRVIQEGKDPQFPYGLPSDDLHPEGEAHAKSIPPGAPDEPVSADASIDWGTRPGEEVVRDESAQTRVKKPEEAA